MFVEQRFTVAACIKAVISRKHLALWPCCCTSTTSWSTLSRYLVAATEPSCSVLHALSMPT